MPRSQLWLHAGRLATALSLMTVSSCQPQIPNVQTAASSPPGSGSTGFRIQNTPRCLFPPSAVMKTVSGGGQRTTTHFRYGTGTSPFGVSYGSLIFRTNSEGVVEADVQFSGNSGPHYDSIYVSKVPLPVTSLDEDFSAPLTAVDAGYVYNNDVAVLSFPGIVSGNIAYTANTGRWEIQLQEGQGTMPPESGWVYNLHGGTATYAGQGTFETAPCPSLNLELSAQPEFISPANEDGQFDAATFQVKSTPASAWELSIQGNKPGPPDDKGLPTVGEACSWRRTGNSAEEEVGWNGKCDDGAYMVDGAYTAVLKSGEEETSAQVKIDNTQPRLKGGLRVQFGEESLLVRIDPYDPEVNGVSSGLQNATIEEGTPQNRALSGEFFTLFDEVNEYLSENQSGFKTLNAETANGNVFEVPYTALFDIFKLKIFLADNVSNNRNANKFIPNLTPIPFSFPCLMKGSGIVGSPPISLINIFDFHRGFPNTKAVTLVFNIRDVDNKTTGTYGGNAWLNTIKINGNASLLRGVKDEDSWSVVGSERYQTGFFRDGKTDIFYGNQQGGFISPPYRGLSNNLGVNDWVSANSARLFVAVDLNQLGDSDQIIDILIPSKDGKSNVLKLMFVKSQKKGENWSQVKCLN